MIQISDILKINGFHKKGSIFDRDDGIQINLFKHSILFENGDIFSFKNKFELLGYLVLRNIINRLF